ncbi:DsbA family oxidoreductase [Paenibacillus sp. FSL R10-2782]|uniref:DsbA family oxidoreductase n=1 Tax=Paenibacillus sp. FSL R10-2782 TaxID=2954661 RepID=UPI003158FEBB
MATSTNSQDSTLVTVDVWSDIACPFCYMGTTALQQAIDQFEHGHSVQVVYHSFQLNPELPEEYAQSANEFLAHEMRVPVAQAAAMNQELSVRAATLGLKFQTDSMILTNTRRAHRLIHFARKHGQQVEMVKRLFRAHYTDSLHIGHYDVLADLADKVGLDRQKALATLESDAFEDAVKADLSHAQKLGIKGVPFILLNGKYTLTGAQPVGSYLKALQAAWEDRINQ